MYLNVFGYTHTYCHETVIKMIRYWRYHVNRYIHSNVFVSNRALSVYFTTIYLSETILNQSFTSPKTYIRLNSKISLFMKTTLSDRWISFNYSTFTKVVYSNHECLLYLVQIFIKHLNTHVFGVSLVQNVFQVCYITGKFADGAALILD